MKTLITLFLAAALIGCNGGDGGSSDAAKNPESPTSPSGPFDPNKEYAEIRSGWVWLLNPYIEVRYEQSIDRVYHCDEDFCRVPTRSDAKSDDLDRGDCITSSSYLYGAYRICFTDITEDLQYSDSVWVSIEEI